MQLCISLGHQKNSSGNSQQQEAVGFHYLEAGDGVASLFLHMCAGFREPWSLACRFVSHLVSHCVSHCVSQCVSLCVSHLEPWNLSPTSSPSCLLVPNSRRAAGFRSLEAGVWYPIFGHLPQGFRNLGTLSPRFSCAAHFISHFVSTLKFNIWPQHGLLGNLLP